jgi:hypothetical protein
MKAYYILRLSTLQWSPRGVGGIFTSGDLDWYGIKELKVVRRV